MARTPGLFERLSKPAAGGAKARGLVSGSGGVIAATGIVIAKRDYRAAGYSQQFGPVGAQPLRQKIESGKAGTATENAADMGAQAGAPLQRWAGGGVL